MLRNVRICVFLVAECLQGLSNRCEGNPGWVFWTAFLINSRVPAVFFTIGGFFCFLYEIVDVSNALCIEYLPYFVYSSQI